MDLETIRKYCLDKKGVTEELPFDEDSPVYKVMGKIFLIASLTHPVSINLKCDPEKAVELRELYDAVTPGYHMNKKHWNTVILDSSLPQKLILEWIDLSYDLVLEGLSRKEKLELSKIK
ncbi:MAG TPA: MmcQ/YjbR family DNA-binding protein [Ignavibacteriaceae bacterium]|nr:MmcQ/YjbR family DNA-binding protein [Ignavibacteriaceae bacterium]